MKTIVVSFFTDNNYNKQSVVLIKSIIHLYLCHGIVLKTLYLRDLESFGDTSSLATHLQSKWLLFCQQQVISIMRW